MIRLRCPHHGCTIETTAEFAGKWVRCPHCGQSVFIDPPPPDDAGRATTPREPRTEATSLELQPKPRPDASGESEQRVHAGLPPLSIMLGVRKGRGKAWDDEAARAEMTPADWQALAAFETVCRAVLALRDAQSVGIGTAALTALLWGVVALAVGPEVETIQGRWIVRVIALTTLVIGLAWVALGRSRLPMLRMGVLTQFTPWACLMVALILLAAAIMNVLALNGRRYEDDRGLMEAVATPFQCIGAVLIGRAGYLVHTALRNVAPPALLYRLKEALAFLAALDDYGTALD